MPLTNSVFNCCKSENKWSEAALVERVTVATRNAEIEGSVNSEDIVFFDTPLDFEKSVSELIEAKEKRDAIAKRAYQSVCNNKLTIRDYETFAEYMLSFCK